MFFNGLTWDIVYTKEVNPGITNWSITGGTTSEFSITFYGASAQVYTETGFGSWQEAVDVYKTWARNQTFAAPRNGKKKRIAAVLPSTIQSGGVVTSNLLPIGKMLGETSVVFASGYRVDASDAYRSFDTFYPEYRTRSSFKTPFKDYEAFGVICPYINGILADGDAAAISVTQHSPAHSLKYPDAATEYTYPGISRLKWICPNNGTINWENRLYNGPNGTDGWKTGVLNSNNENLKGVYLDVVCGAEPKVCQATDHNHVAGDAYNYIAGTKAILAKFQEAEVVAVEGFSELYLPYIDVALVYYKSATDWTNFQASQTYNIFYPLLDYLYGDLVTFSGYEILATGTPTSVIRVATTVTVTMPTAHYLKTGDIVKITGAVETGFNTTPTVTVTGANTFTYTSGTSGNTTATGTIVVQGVIDPATFLAKVERAKSIGAQGLWTLDQYSAQKLNSTGFGDVLNSIAPKLHHNILLDSETIVVREGNDGDVKLTTFTGKLTVPSGTLDISGTAFVAESGCVIDVLPAATFTSDYNIFPPARAGLFKYNNVEYSTLTEWQSASGQDTHSVQATSLVLNENNSITYTGSKIYGIKYWTNARPIALNGEPRPDHGSDIGCYQSTSHEFHPVNL